MENELTFFQVSEFEKWYIRAKDAQDGRNGLFQGFLRETLGNSLSNRLREILGKNVDLENEPTFYMLASSKIGIFAEKIRKLSEWGFPGSP